MCMCEQFIIIKWSERKKIILYINYDIKNIKV